MNDFRETPSNSGRPPTESSPSPAKQRRDCAPRFFPNPIPGSKHKCLRIDARRNQRPQAAPGKTPPLPQPHPNSAERSCIDPRGALHVHHHHPAAAGPRKPPPSAGSASSPLTSFTMSAPAASAASATAAFEVSIEINPSHSARSAADHRNRSRDFLLRRNRLRARSGRFPADVDQLRPFGDHPPGMPERAPECPHARHRPKTNPASHSKSPSPAPWCGQIESPSACFPNHRSIGGLQRPPEVPSLWPMNLLATWKIRGIAAGLLLFRLLPRERYRDRRRPERPLHETWRMDRARFSSAAPTAGR